jgi:hypothetical protein
MKVRTILLALLGLMITALPGMADDKIIYDDGGPFGNAGVPISGGYAVSNTVDCGVQNCTPTDLTFWTVTPDNSTPQGGIQWSFTSAPVTGVGYNSGVTPVPDNLACQSNGVSNLCEIHIQLEGTLSQPGKSWLNIEGLVGDVEWAFSSTGSSQAQICLLRENGDCGATLTDITPEAFNVSGTAVPEPGSVMMFGSGLLGVFGVLRRRMR